MAGLKPWELERMTFAQLHFFLQGIRNKEEESWRHTRMLMWASMQPHTKKTLRPEKIIKLSSDIPKGKPISKERYQELIDRYYPDLPKA